MKKVINLHPESEEGKRHLAQFITESLGEADNDWFDLRLNIKTNAEDNIIQSVYVGTGWQTPQWAEIGDHGPSFSEKQQFQMFFTDWFSRAGISPNPTTPETICDFFTLFLTHFPKLSEYFRVIE